MTDSHSLAWAKSHLRVVQAGTLIVIQIETKNDYWMEFTAAELRELADYMDQRLAARQDPFR